MFWKKIFLPKNLFSLLFFCNKFRLFGVCLEGFGFPAKFLIRSVFQHFKISRREERTSPVSQLVWFSRFWPTEETSQGSFFACHHRPKTCEKYSSCCCSSCTFPFVSFPLWKKFWWTKSSSLGIEPGSVRAPAKCSINCSTETLLHQQWKNIYLS